MTSTDSPRAGATTGPVRPGQAAVAVGEVWHRRNGPTVHQFSYPVKQVWLDPDRPQDLFDTHTLWSDRSPRPVQFRAGDYLDGTDGPFGPTLRSELEQALGARPNGPIRMLSQPRIWGWLFNPITIYLAWADDEAHGPCGAVLEVTNTPWKERHRYTVPLAWTGDGHTARFAKRLHVSPFLDEDHEYRLVVGQTVDDAGPPDTPPGQTIAGEPCLGPTDVPRSISVALDVVPNGDPNAGPGSGDDQPILETRLEVQLLAPDPRIMRSMVLNNPFSTHRVSLGIHWQAARLLSKRVPFVAHPGKRS